MPSALARLARSAAVVPVVLTGAAGMQIAGAGTALAGCPTSTYYGITSHTSYHLPAPGTYYKDGPGGTMTVSVTQASTINASVTATAGVSVSGLIATAKAEVSATIGASQSITVGHTYSHGVTAGRYGNLQYGSWGYSLAWKYYQDTPTCTTVVRSSGTAKVPTNAVGWRYWETT